MLGVGRITDGSEELCVTGDSAAVLRGTCPLALETDRVLQGFGNILE
jgi:hypothetical protein